METLLAKERGFCFGVKRAIGIVEEVARESLKPVHTLGPIVHNVRVVQKLQGLGITVTEDISELEGGILVTRAHGVAPRILEEAKSKGLRVIDATCPLVVKVQKLAKSLYDDGYQVIIFGKKEHPEVKGIAGWIGDNAIIVEDLETLRALERRKKIGVLSQTTQVLSEYQQVVGSLIGKCQELRAYNTICNATSQRQEAATAVAQRVDVMIVVGDHHSSNTRKLAEICRKVNERTFHISTADDLNTHWFAAAKTAGVTAGASTPDEAIYEVVIRLGEL